MKIDLHIHSGVSKDGELPPSEIVDLAKKQNVDVIAIADHDRTAGIKEAVKRGKEVGIEVIPAVEMFASHDGISLHILGYGINPDLPYVEELFKKVEVSRSGAVKNVINNALSQGLMIREEDVYEFSKGEIPLYNAFAYAMLKNDVNIYHPYINGRQFTTENLIDICRDYLAYGKCLNGGDYVPTSEHVLDIIKKMGGIPVLAHPGYNLRLDEMYIIDELVDMGLQGLEAYYIWHNEEQTKAYKKYCEDKGLIKTCGSDFHGKFKPEIMIGDVQSDENEEIIKELKKRINSERNNTEYSA